jgi:hypothetical protein
MKEVLCGSLDKGLHVFTLDQADDPSATKLAREGKECLSCPKVRFGYDRPVSAVDGILMVKEEVAQFDKE